MNARTSKLIRRFCVAKGVDYKRTKHYWNKLPRTERNDARLSMVGEGFTRKSTNSTVPTKYDSVTISVR